MEQIVTRILQIEQQAHAITEDAKRLSEHFDEMLRADADKLRQDLHIRAEQHLADIQKTELAAKQEALASVRDRSQKCRDSLLARYEEHSAEWIDTLVRAVIGG